MMEIINGEKVATNNTDGSKVVFRGGKWVPYASGGSLGSVGGPSHRPEWEQYEAHPPPSPAGMQRIEAGYKAAGGPQTLGQAGADVGMIAGALAPEGQILGPIARMAMTAAGGAAGEKLGGGSALKGAESGAIQQGVGEVAAPAINVLGRYGKNALNQQDVKRVGGYLRNLASWLPTPKSVPEFDAAFRGGEATEKVGNRLAKYETAIANRLKQKPIMQMPAPASVKGGQFATVSTDATFEDVIHQIKQLNDQARYNGPDSSLRWAAKNARQQAHELTQDLGAALNKVHPGLGKRYLAARRQYAGAATLRDIFSEPSLWDASGRMDMSKLQELVANRGVAGYRDELTRIFGRDKTNQLLKKVYRDAPPTARDVAGGLNMGVSVHPGIAIPRVFAHPHLPSSIGQIPRRFPKLPPAAAALLLGQIPQKELGQ
jgi:hypothetical protein